MLVLELFTRQHDHIDAPHFHMHTIKFSAEYRQKRRLRVQDTSAGCALSCTDTSRQQELPSFCLRKQGISVSSTSLRCEHCPSGTYSSGHTVAANFHPHHQGILVIPYLDDWLIQHPDHQVLLCHQSQLVDTLD